MGVIQAIGTLEKRFAWSFLGFVLAVFFGGLSLYTEFWKKNSPLLEYELLGNTPVIDVREKLPELEVLYQKQDIATNGRALSVLLVRVINRGSANLLTSDYDAKAPLGLAVRGARVLRAELLSASNSYLSRVAGLHVQNTSAITFDPVILEADEWYLVKLLVLHRAAIEPSVVGQGKVAGMRSIPLVVSMPAAESEGFWKRAFSGGVWIQIVRIVAYFVGAILAGTVLIAPPVTLATALGTWKRRRVVRRFKAVKKMPEEGPDDFIFRRFIEDGFPVVKYPANILTDSSRLQALAKYNRDKARLMAHEDIGPYRMLRARDDFEALREHNFIKEIHGQWVADPERATNATAFMEYIELMGATNA